MGDLISSTDAGKGRARDVAMRLLLTIAAVLIYGWVNFLLNPVSTILTGQMAGKQFDNSNLSYISIHLRHELLRPSRHPVRRISRNPRVHLVETGQAAVGAVRGRRHSAAAALRRSLLRQDGLHRGLHHSPERIRVLDSRRRGQQRQPGPARIRSLPECQQGRAEALHRTAHQAARLRLVLRLLRSGRPADHRRSHAVQPRMGRFRGTRHDTEKRRLSMPEPGRPQHHRSASR